MPWCSALILLFGMVISTTREGVVLSSRPSQAQRRRHTGYSVDRLRARLNALEVDIDTPAISSAFIRGQKIFFQLNRQIFGKHVQSFHLQRHYVEGSVFFRLLFHSSTL
jgi:hypothetical protein